jgi:hypothetical protein
MEAVLLLQCRSMTSRKLVRRATRQLWPPKVGMSGISGDILLVASVVSLTVQ